VVVSKPKDEEGFVPVKIRWVVEQSIACLNRYRRLRKDYEYHTSSSETWVQIAAIQRMTRRLRPDPNNRQAAFKYPKKDKKAA
jgi:putative transposase